MLFQDDGGIIPSRAPGSIHSFSHFCTEKLQQKKCSIKVFERLAPRLIVIFKKEVGSCLDLSNSSSSNFYLNEHSQKIILTLMSVSIRANIQREIIFGLASSIFSSILPNRVTWEGLFESSFGTKFLISYLDLSTVMPPGTSPSSREVSSDLLTLLEKLLNMDSNGQAVPESMLLPFSALRGIFAAIAASYHTDLSVTVWGDSHSRVLSCVEKATRICSPFNIPDTSRLLVRTLSAGIAVVNYLKAQDAKNMTPTYSFATSSSSSAAPNSVSKWKSPAAQLGYIESSSASSRLFDCATAVFACKGKVDEPILNELCVSVFSVCSQSSKTLVASTFQFALGEILQQMRKVNVLKEMAHMSFAAAEGFSDLTASTSRNGDGDEEITTSALTLTHETLYPSEGELTQLSSSLNSVTHIIISLMELLEFYQSNHSQDRLGFGEHQPYFNSLLVIASRASLHLLLSRHALLRPGDGELTDEPRSVADSSVRSSSESNFKQQNKRGASANLTSNSLFYSANIKISETPEVNAFLELIFVLFAREVAYLGYGDSSLQKFMYACLEICHQNCKDESHFNLSPLNEEYNGDENAEGLPTESEMIFNEVSTIGLVHALGQAALAVRNVYFIRIAVEGLSGLLSYRLGYHVVSALIRQLVQLVTLTPLTVMAIDDETTSNISYLGLRSLVLDTVITSFEREYTTLMHIIEHNKSSNGSTECSKSIFIGSEYLAAASDALLYLSERVFRLGECATLTAIKYRLTDLFIRLCILVYSQDDDGQPTDIDLVEGLVLLLHPLSILFELESILRHHRQNHGGKRKGSGFDLERHGEEKQQFRSLWFVLVMFRVKETARWGHYSNWLTCLQRIAATSPSLVFHPSPNLTPNGITISDGLLALDLTSDPILGTLLINGRKSVKGGSSLFSKNELTVIGKFAKFDGSKLTLPELYFAVTVQFCESLRSGGSLDFRPVLVYLEKSECKSLQNVMVEMAQHVFSVWLEAANARLSDANIAELDVAIVAPPEIERENHNLEQPPRAPLSHHEENDNNGLGSLKLVYGLCDFSAVSSERVRSIIREVFLHILSRVAHTGDILRQFSLFAARHIIDRLLWLKRSCEGVFFLLDCLHELEIVFALTSGKPSDLNNALQATHYAYVHQQIASRNQASLSSSYVCATELWFGELHRAVSDLGCALSLAELPNTHDKIREVACDIMEFAYFWFCNASGELYSVDTTSLLQEYLLLSHIHAIQNIHIGASIANELKCLTVPQYHVVPYTYTVFCNERIAAAKKMSQLRSEHLKVSAVIKFKDRAGESSSSAENTVSSSASDRIGARQTEQFNLKSHFISEIAAIEHPSVKEEEEINSLVVFSRDVCRALAEMRSGYAFAEGEAGLIVEVLWRAAALLYVWNSSATQAHASHHIHSHRHQIGDVTIHNAPLSPWDRAIFDRQSAVLIEALASVFRHNICQPQKQHVTECIVDIWKWLIASSPKITCALIASIVQSLQVAIVSSSSSSSRFLADTLTLLSDFFDDILLSQNSEVAILLFSFIEFYVQHVSEGEHVAVYVCIFKVLSLGLRLINLSFTQHVRISINRRRMFRENIIFCALKYFQAKTLSPDSIHTFAEYSSSKAKGKRIISTADSEVLLLSNFLKDVHSDSKFWTLDYRIDTAAVAAAAKAKKSGKAMDRSVFTAYGGSGNNEELAQNVPEKFGLSAATIHFYSDVYKSSSSPHRMSHRNKQLLQGQLLQDSKLENVNASVQTSRHGGKVRALLRQRSLGISGFEYKSSTTNTVGGSKQKTDPLLFLKAITADGNGSGLLLLLDLLALHEILHNTPSISSSAKADPTLLHSLSAVFKVLSKSDDAYTTAVHTAYAFSPLLALTVFKRFEDIRQARRRPNLSTHPAMDAFEKLLVHRPSIVTEYVHNYWQLSAAFVNIVSLESITPSNGSGQQEERMKTLVFLPSVPVYVAVALLSRCDADRREKRLPALEANKIPAVVRFLVRSLLHAASEDLNSIISYLPQLLQLLRRDEFQCLHFLIAKLGRHSAILCHRLVWMLQTEANPSQDIAGGGKKGKEPKYGLCNTLHGSDPLPSSAKSLLDSVCISLPHSAKLFCDAQVDYFNRVTNISAILRGEKDKDRHAEIICSSFADSIKLSQGLYMPTRPDRLVVGVNYESAAPMQSAAKCPFLLEFQTVEWGGPDDMLKVKIQQHESSAIEGGNLIQEDSPRLTISNGHEEQNFNAGKRLGRSIPSVTTPKRVVLEIDSDEEDEEKKSLSSSSSFSSSDSENQKGFKKHNKSKKSSNARRRKGAAASNGIGKKDQLVGFSPKKPQYFRLASANPSTTSLAAFSISSSYSSSSPSSPLAKKGPPNQSLTSKLGFQSRAGDYAYNSAEDDRVSGADEDGDFEEKDEDQSAGVHDEEEEEEDPLAFQQQRAANESLASHTYGVKDHNGLLAILSSGLKDKTSGQVDGEKRGMDVWSAKKKMVRAAHAGPKIYRDACIFKVFDDCRQDVITMQVISLMDAHFAKAGLPVYLRPYSVIPNRSGLGNNIGAILEVIPNVKSRDQMGKYGSKTLLQYYQNQFGDRGSYEFRRAQWAFAKSLAGYAVVCYLLRIKDRHNGNILIDKDGHLIHIDYGFILGISPGGNLGFETAAFKFSQEMVELLDGRNSEVFESFLSLCCSAFLSIRGSASTVDEILSIVSAFADSDLPCFKYKEDVLVRLKSRFMPGLATNEASDAFKRLILSASSDWTTSAYDGIQKLQNNIYSEKWK